MKPLVSKVIFRFIAILALHGLTFASLRAADTNFFYLAPDRPDSIALLAPPPLPGSDEEAGDLVEVRFVHAHHDTNEDVAARMEDSSISLTNFAPVIGEFLVSDQLPKTQAFFRRVYRDTELQAILIKNHWNRARPYVVDPSLADGKPANYSSYPSGHSTLGMTFALVLVEIFPEKRDALLAKGCSIGWHRVMLAKHYPTDVFAGRVLAQAIVRELNATPDFQRALAEVKAEITAAKTAATEGRLPAGFKTEKAK